MTPEKMLRVMSEAGTNAGLAYDDEENGWFGWSFRPMDAYPDRGMLTIKFEPAEHGQAETRRFWVVPA